MTFLSGLFFFAFFFFLTVWDGGDIYLLAMSSQHESAGNRYHDIDVSGDARIHMGNVYNMPQGELDALQLIFDG